MVIWTENLSRSRNWKTWSFWLRHLDEDILQDAKKQNLFLCCSEHGRRNERFSSNVPFFKFFVAVNSKPHQWQDSENVKWNCIQTLSLPAKAAAANCSRFSSVTSSLQLASRGRSMILKPSSRPIESCWLPLLIILSWLEIFSNTPVLCRKSMLQAIGEEKVHHPFWMRLLGSFCLRCCFFKFERHSQCFWWKTAVCSAWMCHFYPSHQAHTHFCLHVSYLISWAQNTKLQCVIPQTLRKAMHPANWCACFRFSWWQCGPVSFCSLSSLWVPGKACSEPIHLRAPDLARACHDSWIAVKFRCSHLLHTKQRKKSRVYVNTQWLHFWGCCCFCCCFCCCSLQMTQQHRSICAWCLNSQTAPG